MSAMATLTKGNAKMSNPIPDHEAREAWENVRKFGGYKPAARETGIPENTLRHRTAIAVKRWNLPWPMAVDAPFKAEEIPDKARDLEELLRHRRAESERARQYEDAIRLLRIDLAADGPVGLMVFGDPHIDNPGTDFSLLESHLKIAAERSEYVFAGNIGDLRDNWIGRLERVYASTTVSAKETWKLVEWMIGGAGVRWTWLIRGNHDAWAGINDPLDWISKGAQVGLDHDAGLRIAFRHPNGRETRMHARHDFPGHSLHNPLHALKRELQQGHRDHIVVAGHRHIGADAGDFIGDASVQMVRVSGYKISDSYRLTIGAHAKPIHPAAMIIVDPDEPDTSRARAFCAPTVEEGADYLDYKRKRYNSRPRTEYKRKRA